MTMLTRAALTFTLMVVLLNRAPTVRAAAPWPFTPPTDTFSPSALLDLRSLNEPVAGQSGFVKRTPDGAAFALGSGKPVRFWAVDEYVQNLDGLDAVTHKARWLAKRGVNMVRVHAVLAPTTPGKITDVNQAEVDHIWKLVAAMKKAGIYTTISPYWMVPTKIQASWNVPGGADQSAAALLFWDATMQTGYRAWLRALYATPNSYTGISLADDPAVAIIQIQNEDSMLFWTMQSVKGPALTELETQYGTWLNSKYGSLAAANIAWGGASPAPDAFQNKQGDDFGNGRAGIYIIWQWTQPQTGYQAKRLADQLAFFAETMRRFNADTVRYLRHDLHCRQLINAGNWRPADPVRLFDVERYSYTSTDVMGVNRYVTGVHDGPQNGWAINAGDHYTDESVLLDPRGMPTNIKQPVGYPFILPETQWVAPSAYQAEGPFLIAAYQSLTGVDISYFFADGDVPEWQPPYWKWNIATPEQLGQFPAAALMFREGDIAQGRPAVHEERSLDDLWQRRSPLIAEESGYDPNRDSGDLSARSSVKTGIDPLAFLVGPVEVKLGGDPAKSTVLDLATYINAKDKTVRSDTDQIHLNYGVGYCTVNAPKAQGATGFLNKAGQIVLRDITLRSNNVYATVSVVSMDALPLATSKKILVQMGTIARPTGWQDEDATWTNSDGKSITGKRVLAVGGSLWQIVGTDATLTVKNPHLTTATVLDANGEAAGFVPVTRRGGALTLTLPSNALYVILR